MLAILCPSAFLALSRSSVASRVITAQGDDQTHYLDADIVCEFHGQALARVEGRDGARYYNLVRRSPRHPWHVDSAATEENVEDALLEDAGARPMSAYLLFAVAHPLDACGCIKRQANFC